MTYSDSDSDWHLCEEVQHGGEVYFEDFTNASVEPYGKMDGGSRPHAEIRGVQLSKEVHIILDSGADMSVLPMSYGTTGKALRQAQCSTGCSRTSHAWWFLAPRLSSRSRTTMAMWHG